MIKLDRLSHSLTVQPYIEDKMEINNMFLTIAWPNYHSSQVSFVMARENDQCYLSATMLDLARVGNNKEKNSESYWVINQQG